MDEMIQDVKLLWLFLIGTFLAFLFYVEEVITDSSKIEELGIIRVIILVIINSIIGGVVMVTAYFALVQFFPEWHEYLKVGIAGATAMLGKDAIHIYHKAVKKRGDR
jgi:hypothetical protein